MDAFVNALLGPARSAVIPPEDDWFAPLLGDWAFDYREPGGRELRGEWFFRRVLDGTAIQDLFICPMRGAAPQPDGEYGAAIRVYDPGERCYEMTYVCTKYTKRLRVCREGERIACTLLEDPRSQWVFTEITADTFHWQNHTRLESGELKVHCEVFARRTDDTKM